VFGAMWVSCGLTVIIGGLAVGMVVVQRHNKKPSGEAEGFV